MTHISSQYLVYSSEYEYIYSYSRDSTHLFSESDKDTRSINYNSGVSMKYSSAGYYYYELLYRVTTRNLLDDL